MANVAYDTVAIADSGAANPLSVPITIAANSNRVLVALVTIWDSGTVSVSTITGCGATWTKIGTGTGAGNFRGEVWVGIGPSSGAQTAVVTLTGVPSNDDFVTLYSLYNADQTTGANGQVFRSTAGNLVVTVPTGGMAVSCEIDDNNNRTVSGCTTSLDTTGFGIDGWSAAHCTGTPTSTFTWSGFSGSGCLASACAILPVAAAGGPTYPQLERGTRGLNRGLNGGVA